MKDKLDQEVQAVQDELERALQSLDQERKGSQQLELSLCEQWIASEFGHGAHHHSRVPCGQTLHKNDLGLPLDADGCVLWDVVLNGDEADNFNNTRSAS